MSLLGRQELEGGPPLGGHGAQSQDDSVIQLCDVASESELSKTLPQAGPKSIFSPVTGSKPALSQPQLDLELSLAQQAGASGTAGGPDAA